jgi:hypothetical protein
LVASDVNAGAFAHHQKAKRCTENEASVPNVSFVPTVTLLPTVKKYALVVESKKSVSTAIFEWAKWRVRIMATSLDKKELDAIIAAARAAGRAEGYAQARLDMALERVGVGTDVISGDADTPTAPASTQNFDTKTQKIDALRAEAEKIEANEPYKTRTTVNMTRQIALDYLKNAAPRIVGPSEIIKNTQKDLKLFISFGTMNRAMAALVDAGEVELVEKSRWKYKGAPHLARRA